MALIAILQSHPSQDVLLGYFHAQPELCAELADLVRPTVTAGRQNNVAAEPGGDSSVGAVIPTGKAQVLAETS